jgi:hypothetical protein
MLPKNMLFLLLAFCFYALSAQEIVLQNPYRAQDLIKVNLGVVKQKAITIACINDLRYRRIGDLAKIDSIPKYLLLYNARFLNASKSFSDYLFLKIESPRTTYYFSYHILSKEFFILQGTCGENQFPEFIDFLCDFGSGYPAKRVFQSRKNFQKYFSFCYEVEEINFTFLTNEYLFHYPTQGYFLPSVRKEISLHRVRKERFKRVFWQIPLRIRDAVKTAWVVLFYRNELQKE